MSEVERISHSVEETLTLGRLLGGLLEEGDVLALNGELGAGKTTFVRGLAEGIGMEEGYRVTSPTYVLMQEYPGRIPIYHYDLYRIRDERDAMNLGSEDILGKQGVSVVEWLEKVPGFWTGPILSVKFDFLDETRRKLGFSGTGVRERGILTNFERLACD